MDCFQHEYFNTSGKENTLCQNCRIYLQKINVLQMKILALESERGLQDTLLFRPSGKKPKPTISNKCYVDQNATLNLDDTVSFPKPSRVGIDQNEATWDKLGAKPNHHRIRKKNGGTPGPHVASTNIQLSNRFQPLSELNLIEQEMSAVPENQKSNNFKNRSHGASQRNRDKESVTNVKDRDILLLGDGAISDINNSRTITCSYPSAMVTDIAALLPQVISKHHGVKQLILHVGAVDTRKGESEVLKQDFSKLLEKLDKLKIQSFVSGPLPNIDRRINKFSRLLALNTWLSKACEIRGVHFIDNFNLFWQRDDLFKGKGPYLSRSGVRRLTDNLLHSLRHHTGSGWPSEQLKDPLREERSEVNTHTKPATDPSSAKDPPSTAPSMVPPPLPWTPQMHPHPLQSHH
uniref:OSK domain-containing protein n=1 Tax=Mastacembelus armatus TaxID=205130 RepID=A0A7N9AQ54_9TELE